MNTSVPKSLKTIGRYLITVVIACSIFAAGSKLIGSYNVTAALGTGSFFVATSLAILYRLLNPFGWTLVLSGLGYKTNGLHSTRVWLTSESRRWLPGGVWGYASRAVQSGQLGVPVSVASGSMVVELLVTILAAAIVSVLGLALYFDQLSATFLQLLSNRFGGGSLAIPIIGGFVASSVLVFFARKQFISKLQRLTERFQSLRTVRLQWRPLASALAYMIVMATLNGCVNQTLLNTISEDGSAAASVPVLVMVAATATAWIVGFLAFFSPGGLLVREATLAALLLPWLPYEAGITLAVLSRVAQLLAEVLGLLIACIPPKAIPQSANIQLN